MGLSGGARIASAVALDLSSRCELTFITSTDLAGE